MSVNFSPCVLIPCYNHGAMMPGVLARLKPFNLPCIVVDDGSDAATQQQLDNLVSEQPGVTLIRLAENAGKGAGSDAWLTGSGRRRVQPCSAGGC